MGLGRLLLVGCLLGSVYLCQSDRLLRRKSRKAATSARHTTRRKKKAEQQTLAKGQPSGPPGGYLGDAGLNWGGRAANSNCPGGEKCCYFLETCDDFAEENLGRGPCVWHHEKYDHAGDVWGPGDEYRGLPVTRIKVCGEGNWWTSTKQCEENQNHRLNRRTWDGQSWDPKPSDETHYSNQYHWWTDKWSPQCVPRCFIHDLRDVHGHNISPDVTALRCVRQHCGPMGPMHTPGRDDTWKPTSAEMFCEWQTHLPPMIPLPTVPPTMGPNPLWRPSCSSCSAGGGLRNGQAHGYVENGAPNRATKPVPVAGQTALSGGPEPGAIPE